MATGSMGYGETFDIKGFIDDNLTALDGFKNYPPMLSSIENYQIQLDDVFVCSMGNTNTKRSVCEKLKERGANFLSIVHKTAIVRMVISFFLKK